MSEIINIEGQSHILLDENFSKNAKVKVVGVGGAGGNALNRMKEMDIQNVEFIAINTDALALEHSLADEKIAIGKDTTKNLGAGARPEVGRKAILEDKEAVAEKLAGADMVFIAAGMGGGTGTGAAPVVAEIARSMNILTVAVVSMPFRFEGPVRRRNAQNGRQALKDIVDAIIVIDNQSILKVIEKNTTTEQAFRAVDEVLGNAVRGVVDIIMCPGTINTDFHDIERIMQNGGTALMGTGFAEGEDRALKAAEAAITCPLLGDINIKGASAVLVNISHGENFTMMELDAAMSYISEAVGISDTDSDEGNEEIIFGECVLPELGDKISITVFATRFYDDIRETPRIAQAQTTAPMQAQSVLPMQQMQQAPQTQQMEFSQPAQTLRQKTINSSTVSHRETYTSQKTTNFAAMLAKKEEHAPLQTSIPFSGYANTQDIRVVGGVEEELSVRPLAAHAQSAVNENFVESRINDMPSFREAPTISSPVLNNNNDSVSCGIDLSNPPTDSYKRDTRTMESYRNGFTGNGAEF